MPQPTEKINDNHASPSVSLRISPIALGITAPLLWGKDARETAAVLRSAANQLDAIAAELDGGSK